MGKMPNPAQSSILQVRNPETGNPKKPNEIPVPGRNPEIIPPQEPEPGIWPKHDPEIQPEREPLISPQVPTPEIPEQPDRN